MALEDRGTWDRRHADRAESAEPSEFLKEIFQAGIWPIHEGRALDIATGKGRNALYLAELGFQVEGVDVSDVALEEARRRAADKNLIVTWKQADLDRLELAESAYDLIVNFNFLERFLVPKIKAALKLGGHVIFETFIVDQRVIGHPKNPAYLLGHNELLRLFKELRVLWYREGKFAQEGKAAFRAGLFAQRVS